MIYNDRLIIALVIVMIIIDMAMEPQNKKRVDVRRILLNVCYDVLKYIALVGFHTELVNTGSQKMSDLSDLMDLHGFTY